MPIMYYLLQQMICLLQIVMCIITLQKHLVNVNRSNIIIYSKSFGNTSARIWNAIQSKFEVNVSISKFKIFSKMYLQEHSLKLKYTN